MPRTQARSSGFGSDFSSALCIMGKATFSLTLPSVLASKLNVSVVHCAILLDRSRSRFQFSKHLRGQEPGRETYSNSALVRHDRVFRLLIIGFFSGLGSNKEF